MFLNPVGPSRLLYEYDMRRTNVPSQNAVTAAPHTLQAPWEPTRSGNHYFPPDSIRREYFRTSDQHTHCPWKGEASYYDIEVEGEVNEGAAWYYPDPKEAAAKIKDRVAFWKGVEIE